MVEAGIAPSAGAVAGSAIRSKATAMVIIRCVTGVTVRRCATINAICMTGVTGQVIVAAGQWETCIIMIKGRTTPTGRSMAGTAIRTKLPIVRISGSMTGNTIRWCAIELPVAMTGCAGGIIMLACQRESRNIVVKVDILPAAGDMAGFTGRSKLPVVGIS